MQLLNETAIDSATLAPVIRTQVHRYAGVKGSDRVLVRVYQGRSKRQTVGGRAWLKRGYISICLPMRVTPEQWKSLAPRLAQVTAELTARYIGRHAQLGQTERFSAPADTVPDFAAAADVPFIIRQGYGKTTTMMLEARLEYVTLLRRHWRERVKVTREKYHRYRNWEKQLRHRLKRLGSPV